jgi:hypothetical protein
MPKPNTEMDAAKLHAMATRLKAERDESESLEPMPDLMAPFTPLESLALLRCRVRAHCGHDEQGEKIYRDVADLNEIRNFLSIVESASAPKDGLGDAEADERADRVASSLVTAYIWARLKQSAQTGEVLDPRAMGATQSPEFRRVLRQLEREKRVGGRG